MAGLNHILLIWLRRYSDLLRLLSFRLRRTMAPRIESFCCCNSRRLFCMRRRVTYASGGHFIRPHISMLFWSHLGSPGGSFRSPLGIPGRSLASLRSLLYAQAAEIRVRHLFHIIVHIWGGLYFMHRLRGSAPSAACGSPGCSYSMRRLRRFTLGSDFSR